ncbi:hypothetical protein Rhal01_02156 [Rubritalea halochordaticola]|uniref:DUF3568 family protein n=1 Tax=Rubritalea halochordaticola TaxID=714537 RepID=A0ABP9V022_9BACT
MNLRSFVLGFVTCLVLGGGLFLLLACGLKTSKWRGGAYVSSDVPMFAAEGETGCEQYQELGSEAYAQLMEDRLELEMRAYFRELGSEPDDLHVVYRGDATRFTFFYSHRVLLSWQQDRELDGLRERLAVVANAERAKRLKQIE